MLRHTSSWILSNSMTSLDNQFQCFNITVVKTFFLIRSFHVYNSLCPLLLIISLYITEKSQVLSSPLYLPLRSFLTALKSPLGHLFLKLSWSSSLSLTLCATWYSSPTTSFGFHNSTLFLFWGAQNWMWCSTISLTNAKHRGRIFPWTTLLATHPRDAGRWLTLL